MLFVSQSCGGFLKQLLGPRKSLINVCDYWVHPFGLPLQTWSPGHFYIQTFWAQGIVVA